MSTPEADSDRFQRAIDQLFELSRDADRRHGDLVDIISKQNLNMSMVMKDLEKQMALLNQNACPTPGACTALDTRLHKLEDVTDDMRMLQGQWRFGWQTLMVLGSAVLTVLGVAAEVKMSMSK